MIKVIASDLDGTLLAPDHRINHKTAAIVRKACDQGYRFLIVTGRNFEGVRNALAGEEIVCDYILSSGAEVRNEKQEILFSKFMRMEDCKRTYEVLESLGATYVFCGKDADYCIGDEKAKKENIIAHIHSFNQTIPLEKIPESDSYRNMMKSTKAVPSFEYLKENGAKIRKVFIFSHDLKVLENLKKELVKISGVDVSSSFFNNLEVTDQEAQKGPVLKNYIESLGYRMEELMVFGDSLNDYSMLSMDFGATIAMENAHPDIKVVSKYVTKSNAEDGVAYAIEELLKRQGRVMI